MITLQTKHSDDVKAFLVAQYGDELKDLGETSLLTFRDERGIVCVLLYNHFVWPNIAIHIVARPRALWCKREILFHIFNYPFGQLRCARVTAPVKATNKASIKVVEHLGFVKEGILRRAGRQGEDTLIYGMLKEECRWLELQERKVA